MHNNSAPVSYWDFIRIPIFYPERTDVILFVYVSRRTVYVNLSAEADANRVELIP